MTAAGAAAVTPLEAEIRALIAAEGPLPIDRYMALCLGHPRHGYYMTRDPFGTAGDFTTAPEVSQMFGELLGLWAGAVWQAMGAPARVVLAEIGPGRGTLMADALRAARAVPGFLPALAVHLVETSPVLAARQKATLAGFAGTVIWHRRVEDLPPGPLILIANEFLDALPIRQFVATPTGFRERVVGLAADPAGGERLAFGLGAPVAPGVAMPAAWRALPAGSVVETAPAAVEVMALVAGRIARQGGAALFIDYGSPVSGTGDTLQAVSRHGFADPLATPGDADLTAHVDFDALAKVARQAGAAVDGPAPQGAFLSALGLHQRAARLAALPGQADAIAAAVTRLAGPSPEGMGELFQVMALRAPHSTTTPGPWDI